MLGATLRYCVRVITVVVATACFIELVYRLGRPVYEWTASSRVGGFPHYALWFAGIGAAWVLGRLVAGVPDVSRVPWWPIGPRRQLDWWVLAGAVAVSGVLHLPKIWLVLAGDLQLPRHGLELVAGAILAPVAEEWLFRGIMWRQLAGEASRDVPVPRLLVAVVVTSVIFSLSHLPRMFPTELPDVQAVPLVPHAIYGAAMAAVRWRFGSIAPCIAIHAVWNGLYFFTTAPQ